MTANEFIQYLSWIVYMAIFVNVAIEAVRHPLRANIDIALFFSVAALIIVFAALNTLGIKVSGPFLTALDVSLLLAMAYLLLRLVDDFSDVPAWFMRFSEAALALFVVSTFWYSPKLPTELILIMLAYLVALLLYTVVAFIRKSVQTNGVTRRRMFAAALGSICLCVDFLVLGLGLPFPQLNGLWGTLSTIVGLASGVFYFMGFATPGLLRRAWQEPELRAFLGRAATLPGLATTEAIVAELEKGAATSLGTPHAKIGLWDEELRSLNFILDGKPVALLVDTPKSVTARAFLTQQTTFTDNLPRDNPSASEAARQRGAIALLVAPITANETRLGVLTAYAPHSPIFASEDMSLVQLLADQAAVILESRALIDEATRVRAREEVARLKEDFLSAAAHDLKTPLTSLVGHAQLMERRIERNPDAPADREGLRKIVREANRLKVLVLELLDAARAEEGRLLGRLEPVDLTAVAKEICLRYNSERHPCKLEAQGAVTGDYDPARIRQLLDNLVDNAVKYSPDGGTVIVGVWAEDEHTKMTVTDHGISIPKEDLPFVFERFHRGANVDDKRFAGMGLGLFICREIVKQHGGTISVMSKQSEGTTFTIELPLRAASTAEKIPGETDGSQMSIQEPSPSPATLPVTTTPSSALEVKPGVVTRERQSA